MSSFVRKIISVAACAVLAAIFVVVMTFAAPTVAVAPETYGEITYYDVTHTPDGESISDLTTAVIGEDVTATRIADYVALNKITKVNYVADKFVHPGSFGADVRIVDLTKPFEFAERGTLIFVIMNLDPWHEDFDKQVAALSQFRIGDYLHFSLSLPMVFSAANVYDGANLVARHGEIADYDFIEFTTAYDKRTEKFSAEASATTIDLTFYTRRQAMNVYRVVTVHYQSSDTAYSGIRDVPYIGTESAVAGLHENSQNLLIIFAILAVVALGVLIVLSLLKRTREFVSAIVWIAGISVMLLARFVLRQTTTLPILWSAIAVAAPFAAIGGALLALGVRVKKVRVDYVCAALAFSGALLAFVCPFAPFIAARNMQIVCTVIKSVCVVALWAFVVLATMKKSAADNYLKTCCVALIAVAATASLFLPNVYPVIYNSVFWLCAAITIMTFVGVFIVFNETEKANSYLTKNLHLEVERQTEDIKAMVAERDNLLRFVSHDMKKPLSNSVALIGTLIDREKDGEQVKALSIVKQNTARVITNLSEIGDYARFNYIAEPSRVADLRDICAELYAFHKPDCEANGVVLKNTVDKHCKAFVKRQGLSNAVSNIIINALEHAECKTITLSVRTERTRVVLCVTDDGRGIDTSSDLFKPYSSDNKPDTGGIGLYICKNIVQSMNGELTYSSERGNTVFSMSLLKA